MVSRESFGFITITWLILWKPTGQFVVLVAVSQLVTSMYSMQIYWYVEQDLCLAWGTYHLLGKTGKFGWKIKWFVPFHLGSLRKVGQCSHQAVALQYPRRKI